jgi:zinc transporter, ZIP family
MSEINILILASLSGLATLIGVLGGKLFKKTRSSIIFSMSFAASLMILISIFELIPAAAKNFSNLELAFWVILGIFVIGLINKIIPHLHSVKEIDDCKDKCLIRMSYLVAIGLVLHDFPEGFAISSSFGHSNSLGLLVALSVFIHNIPEGYLLTIASSESNGNNFYYKSALLSTLATFLGAGLSIVLSASSPKFNPIFLSLAAGAMLFIAIHELLPKSLQNGKVRIFFIGILAAITAYFILRLL